MHSPHTSFNTFIELRIYVQSLKSSSFPSTVLALGSVDGVEGARAAFNSSCKTRASDQSLCFVYRTNTRERPALIEPYLPLFQCTGLVRQITYDKDKCNGCPTQVWVVRPMKRWAHTLRDTRPDRSGLVLVHSGEPLGTQLSGAPALIQSTISCTCEAGSNPPGGMMPPMVCVPSIFCASKLASASPGITTGALFPLSMTSV